MKIVQFTAENIKKLKVVDITPTKDFIQITGKNGSGKTSVLDAIWWALAGKEAIQGEPIRKGEEKAIIKLDLGDMIVTRSFTKTGTTLTVENSAGFKAATPQAMLDAIIGNLTFDPLEFSRMPAKQQFENLRSIAEVDFDFEAAAKQTATDTEDRRVINRDIKNLEGELSGVIVPPDAPDEEVSVKDLMRRLNDIENANALLREDEIKQDNHRITKASLEKKIQALRDELEADQEKLIRLNDTIGHFDQITYASTDEIKAEIAGAEVKNQGYRAKLKRGELNGKIALKQKESDFLTDKMAITGENRTAAMKKAKMPIAGLALDTGVVLFNDIPFAQLSAAEQLRVSVAIAMAANPKLKVIRIKDGSLLDDDSLKMIQAMSADREYQVWIETVDSSGKIGIVMEDGEIKEINND